MRLDISVVWISSH